MLRGEADWMIQLAADEGWNPGLNDAAIFFDTDPGGFLLGELDGEPVGCLSAVAYDNTFGFVGLYIVRPAFRGRGYGLGLWQAGMARLGARNVGLDGVVEQQLNYRRSGFRLAYGQIRHQALGAELGDAGVVALSDLRLEQVVKYDRRHFPVERGGFVRRWLAQPGAHSYGVLHDSGQLAGYGLIRPCRTGHKIGPLFADTPAVAERLLRAMLSTVPGEPVMLDTPEANPAALAMVRRFEMTPIFETARMYTGDVPGLAVEQVYGVTTLELG